MRWLSVYEWRVVVLSGRDGYRLIRERWFHDRDENKDFEQEPSRDPTVYPTREAARAALVDYEVTYPGTTALAGRPVVV